MGNESGRHLRGHTFTHVANATGEPLWVKVNDQPTPRNVSVGVEGRGPIGIGLGANVAVNKEKPQESGYVTLGPGRHLAFRADEPYVSAMTQGGAPVLGDFKCGCDNSVIITPGYTPKHATYGKVWQDTDGKDWSK